MEEHIINKSISNIANVLITKFLFPTVEYNKGNLNNDSYIFAPNHTSDADVYLIWSLLIKNYDLDLFMKKEFWSHFPYFSKCLPYLNIYPISRNKINFDEINSEIKRIKNKDRSLIMFPQGRHVDSEIMLRMFEYHFNTLPLGTFYMAINTDKPIMPIYIEPPKLFHKGVVLYGKEINPRDLDAISSDGTINKKKVMQMAKQWLIEVNNLYKEASVITNRKMHKYRLEKKYWSAKGILLCDSDPNIIVEYLDKIIELINLSNKTGIKDFDKLIEMSGISFEDSIKIKKLKDNDDN